LFSTVQAGGKPFPWLHLVEEKEKKRKKNERKEKKTCDLSLSHNSNNI
jgi:hypothetical protein